MQVGVLSVKMLVNNQMTGDLCVEVVSKFKKGNKMLGPNATFFFLLSNLLLEFTIAQLNKK